MMRRRVAKAPELVMKAYQNKDLSSSKEGKKSEKKKLAHLVNSIDTVHSTTAILAGARNCDCETVWRIV